MNSDIIDAESASSPALCRAGACRRTVSVRPFPGPAIIGAFLTAAALLLGFAAPAQAGEPVLVSNMDQEEVTNEIADFGANNYAQGFRTGLTGSYVLGSIDLNFSRSTANGDLVEVRLLRSKGNGEPGDNASDNICTLDNPTDVGTSGVKTFTAPAACGTLAIDTNYFVYVLYNTSALAGSPRLRKTTLLGQDSTGMAGWTVSDTYYYDPTTSPTVSWLETSNDDVIEIRIRAANRPPTASDNTVSTEDTKTLTFTVDDFGYSDTDGDSLEHVKITSLPADTSDVTQGTLSLDGAEIASASDANPVEVTAKQLTDGGLKYNPPIDTTVSATFGFKVYDGFDDSAPATMTITVSDVTDNVKLSALGISAGTLNFDADISDYTVNVTNDVASVTVTPTADDNDATVTVNGTDVASGSASGEIPLAEGGDTVIQVVVSAEDRATTGTYTFRVTRTASSNANLSALRISAGTLNFDADISDYTVNVTNDVASVTVTPTAAHDSATVTVNDADVASGSTSGEIVLTENEPIDIAVEVTAQDGTTKTYTITVSRAASAPARFSRLNAEILSKHALTLADVTNRAIGERLDDPCGKQSAAYSLAGGSTIHDTLRSNARAIEDGTLTLDDVLAGSSFRLPLAAASGDRTGGGPVVWGRGERQALESTESAFAWDGTVLTGQFGIDGCLRKDLLTGLALSRSIGDFDYTDAAGPVPVSGGYESRMTSVHPYLGWTSPQGLGLWATLGYGQGEIEIDDEQAGRQTSDTSLKTAAMGARGTLITDGSLIEGGTTNLRLKGEASVAQVEVEGNGGLIEEQTVNANRLRLALEGSHEQALASGSSLTPSLELSLRHDGGGGITGTGIEIGGSLRYRDPAAGLTIEGNGRVLAGQSDYREWGLGGSLRLDPGAEGRGLSFSLFPAWGETSSGVDRLWDQDVAELATDDGAANENVPQMRLDSEFGYGFGAFGGRGLLTPYGGFSLAGEGSQRYRIGGRFEIGSSLSLSLEGERLEPVNDAAAEHGMMLRGQMRF